ncbi:hypothetical protein RIEGSTA812A_PEG_855 [invertebrate metagenome]|uniref:Uncharacterized protein n=1 Tax=invertebrate metagenome TaxID=1711999 RepID=A0A484HC44_9ZZZZ
MPANVYAHRLRCLGEGSFSKQNFRRVKGKGLQGPVMFGTVIQRRFPNVLQMQNQIYQLHCNV